MNIVVTNDDGLYTEGIWTLAEALTAVGRVSVVAPDREQSGVGMGINFLHPVRVSQAPSRIEGVHALAVEGTPADCIVLAVQGLTPEPVDLVVSGINEGANTGINILVSGTVGGAVQAHFWDIPAVAVSVMGTDGWRFEPAARMAQTLAMMFRDGDLSGPMLLNVNVPNVPLSEIEGVAVTRLAKGRYKETLQKADTPRHDYYYIARGKVEWEAEDGTDVWALRNNRISVTALHIDLTSDVIAPLLSECAPAIFDRVRGEEQPPQA